MNILNLATRDNFSALASSLHEGLLRALLLRFGLSTSNKGILKRVLLFVLVQFRPLRSLTDVAIYLGYRASQATLPNTAGRIEFLREQAV